MRGYPQSFGRSGTLRIAKALQVSPHSVTDLSDLLESDIGKVSHHLRVMYNSGLVKTEREGRHIYYALNPEFLRGRASAKALDFGCCKFELRE